eukprot:8619289-Pyramimonas_sp.AAC.1
MGVQSSRSQRSAVLADAAGDICRCNAKSKTNSFTSNVERDRLSHHQFAFLVFCNPSAHC